MYRNLKRFTTSDLPAALRSLARVMIISQEWAEEIFCIYNKYNLALKLRQNDCNSYEFVASLVGGSR